MPQRPLIGRRPSSDQAADRWVRSGDELPPATETPLHEIYEARLTIDVTQKLRGQIKIAAFKRGSTVAGLLREILQREFGRSP
jgi:hypothetical protein